MKTLPFFLSFVLLCSVASAQNSDAFKGKNDTKLQIAANFQNGGSGITGGMDFGVGKSISMGFKMGYLLGVEQIGGEKPGFADRFDLRGRFNANLGKVMQLPSNIDVYPGLDIGLKNFGAHLGARYFFGEGFGLFSEIQFPIAKYNHKNKPFYHLNNQFNVSVGASFNL